MSLPELYPAIDVREGRVVRLRQGDYAQETHYGDDPFAVKELAAIYLSVFVLMYISGPGNYALDRLIAERLRN